MANATDGFQDTVKAEQSPDALESRFHFQGGGLFASEKISAPIAGESWFGGSVQGGYALTRFGKNSEVQASGGLEWADPKFAGQVGMAPDYTAGLFLFTYQNFDRHQPGVGLRMNAGIRYFFTKPPSLLGEIKSWPLISFTIVAQSKTGIYYYLDIGSFIISPVTIGIGFNL